MSDGVDFSHALRAELYMEDFIFLLNDVEYGLNRHADERGSPTDAPKRMMIRASIRMKENQDDYVRLLYDWALNNDKKMDGFIVFDQIENRSVEARRVSFEGATCVGFRECFQSEQINVLRNLPTANVPDADAYHPAYRGREFFINEGINTGFELVISADKVYIESTEIPS